MGLDLGKVYLVRGTPAKFWWFIKDYSPIEILWKPEIATLYSSVSYPGLAEENNIVVILPDSSIPIDLVPDPDTRVFILLSSTDELSSKAEKVYKQIGTSVYQSLDLRQLNYENDKLIQLLLDKLQSPELKNQIDSDLSRNPWRLYWQLQQPNPSEYEVDEISAKDAKSLIYSLGTKESLDLWKNIPRSSIYSLLFVPEIERCGMYAFLAGGGKPHSWGLCPPVWAYYDILYVAWSQKFTSKPELLIKVFVSWVYLASTLWQTSNARGFYLYRSKKNGQNYAAFEPSLKAVKEFYKLLEPASFIRYA